MERHNTFMMDSVQHTTVDRRENAPSHSSDLCVAASLDAAEKCSSPKIEAMDGASNTGGQTGNTTSPTVEGFSYSLPNTSRQSGEIIYDNDGFRFPNRPSFISIPDREFELHDDNPFLPLADSERGVPDLDGTPVENFDALREYCIRTFCESADEALSELEDEFRFVHSFPDLVQTLDEWVQVEHGVREFNLDWSDGAIDDFVQEVLPAIIEESLPIPLDPVLRALSARCRLICDALRARARGERVNPPFLGFDCRRVLQEVQDDQVPPNVEDIRGDASKSLDELRKSIRDGLIHYIATDDTSVLSRLLTAYLCNTDQQEPQSSWFAPGTDLKNLCEELKGVMPNVKNMANNVADVAGSIHENIPIFMNRVDSSISRVENKMHALIDWLIVTVPIDVFSTILQTICLLYRMYQCTTQPTVMSVTVTIVELLLLLKIPSLSYSACVDWVLSASKLNLAGGDGQEPQSETTILNLVFALLGVIFCVGIPGADVLKRATSLASSFNVFTRTAKEASTPIVDLVDKLPNVMRSWFLATCPYGLVQEAVMSGDYRKWVAGVEAASLLAFKEKLVISKKHREFVDSLYEVGKVYHTSLAGSSHKSGTFQHVEKMYERVRRLKSLRDTVESQSTFRMSPFYVYLTSTPGVGKSGVSQRIAAALAPREWDRDRLIYSRNVSDKFWSGYWAGYFAVLYDDFSQDTEGVSNLEAIFANSNASMLVSMPDLEDGASGAAKGCPFSARLFIACSNIAYPQSNAVASHKAEWRRRHILWELKVKSEYSNKAGEIDFSRTPQEVLDRSDFLVWNRKNPIDPTDCNGKSYSTREAMLLMREEYAAHVARQTKLLDSYASDEFLDWLDGDCKQEPQSDYDEGDLMVDVERSLNDQTWSRICKAYNFAVSGVPSDSEVSKHVEKLVCDLCENQSDIPTPESVEKEVTAWMKVKGVAAWIWKHIRVIALGLSMIVGSLAIGYAVGNKTTSFEDQAGAMVSGTDVARKWNRPAAKVQAGHVQRAQDGAESSDEIDVSKRVLAKNQLMLYRVEGDLKFRLGAGIGICGNLFIINYHSMLTEEGSALPDDTELLLLSSNGEIRWKFKRQDMILVMGKNCYKDICFVRFPQTSKNFKDIRSRFLCTEEHNQFVDTPGCVFVNTPTLQLDAVCPEVRRNMYKASYVKGENPGYHFYDLQAYEYPITTAKGWCGAPLVSAKGRFQGRVLGIHRSGKVDNVFRPNYGHAEPVFREEIERAIETFGTICNVPKLDPDVVDSQVPENDFFTLPAIEFVGELAWGRKVQIPCKTSLRPSPIFDLVREHVKEPAVLHPNDPRLEDSVSPMFKSLAKNGTPCYYDDSDDFEEIMQDISDELLHMPTHGCVQRVLTEEEAINGIDGVEFIDKIEMNTSAGYPYKFTDPGKGKKHLFTKDAPYSVVSQNLRQHLDEDWECWMRGERGSEFLIDCLKDELRPIEKVHKGSTRTINVGSLHFLINFRRLFLGFQSYLCMNRKSCSVALGMNPFAEWQNMVDYLRKAGDRFVAGDYGKFDGSMMAQMAVAFADLASEWYDDGPVNRKARRVAMLTIQRAVHIVGRHVYVTDHSNPSGVPITTIYNIFFNMYLLRKAWKRVVPIEMRSMQSFRKHVRCKILGDDNILGVSQEGYVYYNLDTISTTLWGIGIEYTAPDKSASRDIGPELENWTFLKFGFRNDPSISVTDFLPCMNKDTIYDLTNWVRAGEDQWVACEMNCRDALQFAFFWGKDFFDDLRSRIFSAFRVAKSPHVPVLPSWVELRKAFLTGEMQQWQEVQSANTVAEPLVSNPTSTTTTEDDPKATNTTVEQTMSSKNSLGVQSSVQTTTDVQRRTKGDRQTASMVKYMPDIKWTLDDTAKKEAYLATLQWTTLETSFHFIWTATAPYDILPDATQSLGWNAFAFARPAIRLTFRVQANKFCQGLIKIGYFPGLSKECLTQERYPVASLGVPGAFMSACVSGTSSIEIPFTNISGFIRTKGNVHSTDSTGAIGIMVVSPLVLPTGSSTQVQILVTSEFIETAFRVLDPTGLPTWSENQAIISDVQEPQGFEDFIDGLGNIFDKTVGVITKTATAGANLITSLDRPTLSFAQWPTSLRAPEMNYSEGIDYSHKLSAHGKYQRLPSALTWSTSTIEGSISEFCRHYGYLKNFNWALSTPPGTVLFAAPMCPLPRSLPGALATIGVSGAPTLDPQYLTNPTGGEYEWVTPMDYMAMRHMYWAGAIRYRVIIVSSSFHTGQLIFTYYPGQFVVPSSSGNQRTARWFKIFELSAATQEFDVEVPFVSQTPVKHVPNALETTADGSWTTSDDRYSCGTIAISAYTSLQAPPSAVDNVDILVLVSGGDNFTLIHTNVYNRTFIPVYRADTQEAQSDEDKVGSDSNTTGATEMKNLKGPVAEDGVLHLSPDQRKYDPTTYYGDYVDSMIDEMKRFQVFRVRTNMGGDDNYWMDVFDVGELFAILDGQTGATSTSQQNFNLINHYMAAYRFWHGGLKFRVFFDITNVDGTAPLQQERVSAAYFIPGYYSANAIDYSEFLGIQHGGVDGHKNVLALARNINISPGMNFLDFEIPFYTIFESMLSRGTVYPGDPQDGDKLTYSLGTVFMALSGLQTTYGTAPSPQVKATYYVAVGDEFAVAGYLGPPLMALPVNVTPDNYIADPSKANKGKKVVKSTSLIVPKPRTPKVMDLSESEYEMVVSKFKNIYNQQPQGHPSVEPVDFTAARKWVNEQAGFIPPEDLDVHEEPVVDTEEQHYSDHVMYLWINPNSSDDIHEAWTPAQFDTERLGDEVGHVFLDLTLGHPELEDEYRRYDSRVWFYKFYDVDGVTLLPGLVARTFTIFPMCSHLIGNTETIEYEGHVMSMLPNQPNPDQPRSVQGSCMKMRLPVVAGVIVNDEINKGPGCEPARRQVKARLDAIWDEMWEKHTQGVHFNLDSVGLL